MQPFHILTKGKPELSAKEVYFKSAHFPMFCIMRSSESWKISNYWFTGITKNFNGWSPDNDFGVEVMFELVD